MSCLSSPLKKSVGKNIFSLMITPSGADQNDNLHAVVGIGLLEGVEHLALHDRRPSIEFGPPPKKPWLRVY